MANLMNSFVYICRLIGVGGSEDICNYAAI